MKHNEPFEDDGCTVADMSGIEHDSIWLPAGISASDLQAQGVPTALAQLMAANNVTPEELQTVVGQRGYFPADMPVKDYPADFVSGCRWPPGPRCWR